ncbi:MAG: BON domain-containing protein [Sedimentisphaerales bacterium]|nr:BON domain-containing protein [Sedimentisphaerales bacterium]
MRIEQTSRNVKRAAVLVSCMMFLIFTIASGSLRAQEKEIKDQDIITAIEIELWDDPAVASNPIDVEANDGIVILSGTSNNILAKERAEKIAEATVGVRSVVNRIVVQPATPRSNSELRGAVRGALLADPATESYEVQIKVNNGVVTLMGTVDSWQEKQLCETVVKGVKGVQDVKNKINVDIKIHRSDNEIKQEVEERLMNDVRVDDALIHVDVKDEEVILSGIVGSAQEKAQARIDAWVGGVDNVKTDDLEVQWWARDKMRRTELYESRTDEEIKEAIKDAFVYDPRVYSFNVDVNVTKGTVALSGVVDNLEAKMAAERDANNTVGVRYVRNNIKVRPKIVPPDQELENRVSSAFLENPYIDRFDLIVSASNGVIYLSGQVNTSWEKTLAENVAEGVRGTVAVVNNVKYEHEWVWKPDWQLRKDVKDQLWWSPFVDSDDINVSVNNGIVTLSGKTDTYTERQTAEDNAYQGGAKEVVNNLRVSHPYHSPYDHRMFNAPYYYGP